MALSTTTWAGASGVRDTIVTAIEGLTPTLVADRLFRRGGEKRQSIREWAENVAGPACFRRFDVRAIGEAADPGVWDSPARQIEMPCELVMAYPDAPGLYGSGDMDSMERVIESDGYQMRDKIVSPGTLIAGWNGALDARIGSPEWGKPTFLSIRFTVVFYVSQTVA